MCISHVLPVEHTRGEGYKVLRYVDPTTFRAPYFNTIFRLGDVVEAARVSPIRAADGAPYVPLIHVYKTLESLKRFELLDPICVIVKGTYDGATVQDAHVVVTQTFCVTEVLEVIETHQVPPRKVSAWEAFILEAMFVAGGYVHAKHKQQFLNLLGLESEKEYSVRAFKAHRAYVWMEF